MPFTRPLAMHFIRPFLALSVALMLAPTVAAAQRAQPSAVVPARSEAAAPGDVCCATSDPSPMPPTIPRETRRPSAARHALVGGICGVVASTALLLAAGAHYGNGGFPPAYVTAVVTASGAALGAIGGLTVYGVRRLARR
jgi:hypothetical protein